MEGRLDNSVNFNGNPCGALHTLITLAPGESRTIAFILAQAGENKARKLLDSYADPETKTGEEFAAIKTYWGKKLSALQIQTPDDDLNNMVNTWNAYQCFITFIWSRAASLIYAGERNGYGYRDTVQDIQGIIHLDPRQAGKREDLFYAVRPGSSWRWTASC